MHLRFASWPFHCHTALCPVPEPAIQAAGAQFLHLVSTLGHDWRRLLPRRLRRRHPLLPRAGGGSDRIKMFKVGKSTRGEEFEIAVISSPENLARLDEYKSIADKLASTRAPSLTHRRARWPAPPRSSSTSTGGLHSDEVAGGQHSIQLACKLVSRAGRSANRRHPQQRNPREAVADNQSGRIRIWCAAWTSPQYSGASFEVSPMPRLYQDYVGHDNNPRRLHAQHDRVGSGHAY